MLQCAAFAGLAGSAFLFLPALCPFCLNFHQREALCFSVGKDGYFVSEGFSRQLPLATAAHNWLTRLQQGGKPTFLVSVPYPTLKTAHRASQGRVWGSPSFPGALLLRQGSHVPLQLVIYRFLDGRIVNCRVPFRIFPSLVCTFARFNIDKVFVLQLPYIFCNRVSAHPGVLANAPNAWPALIRFPVFTVNQVGAHYPLPWGKPKGENGIGQKKKSALIQPFCVSVFDFCAVTSITVFKKFRPMFQHMTIVKLKFTPCSRYVLASVFRNSFCKAHFFVYCPANFEVA